MWKRAHDVCVGGRKSERDGGYGLTHTDMYIIKYNNKSEERNSTQ